MDVRVRQFAIVAALVFAALVGAFWVWWPLGVLVGLVIGSTVTLLVGRALSREALAGPTVDALEGLFEDR